MRMNISRRMAGLGVVAAAVWMAWGSSSSPVRGTVTALDATAGTLVDVHGRDDVQGVPASCLAGAPPHPKGVPPDPTLAPEAPWLAINPPLLRNSLAMAGYRVWNLPAPPTPPCPNVARNEVYQSLHRFDLSAFLGSSGRVLRAQVVAEVRAVSVDRPFIAQPPVAPSNAFICDGASAGAAAVWSVPPATPLPTGVDVRFVNTQSPARVPLPGAQQIGAWTAKVPTQAATGSSVREMRFDVTQRVVQQLQALEASGLGAGSPPGSAPTMYTVSGTNDPPAIKDGPLPFNDCRAVMRLRLLVEVV